MNIVLGFTDIPSKSGSLTTAIDQVIRVAAPKSFTNKDFTKLRRDCEIILERIKANPDKMQVLMKSAFAGNLPDAQAVAKELKLTEADFEKEGGGCFILLGLAFVILFEIVKHKVEA